ncbi:hypothetical protein [Acidithiobacillus sp.]|uniref:hypothetical protein n=1 Tax=Acidithiobacillus sp. TaxID=1872118 RepID=UPI0032B017F4
MEKRKYWFPAKRYGWGWGLPFTWQGWLTLLAYFLAVLVSVILIRTQIFVGNVVLVLATSVFVWVVWRKGEPPKWRWGGK